MKALLSGLKLLQEYGLQVYDLIIESDSKLLVDMVNKRIKTSWKFWILLDEISASLQNFSFQIQHSYREGNMVADALANKGVSDKRSFTYICTSSLPSQIKLVMMQESRKIRSLRKRILSG